MESLGGTHPEVHNFLIQLAQCARGVLLRATWHRAAHVFKVTMTRVLTNFIALALSFFLYVLSLSFINGPSLPLSVHATRLIFSEFSVLSSKKKVKESNINVVYHSTIATRRQLLDDKSSVAVIT
jgi:hypothetical protein